MLDLKTLGQNQAIDRTIGLDFLWKANCIWQTLQRKICQLITSASEAL